MEDNLKYILKALKVGRCILFLGPGVCLRPDGITTLSKEKIDLFHRNNLISAFYPDDYLVRFKSDNDRTKASYDIKELYEVNDQDMPDRPPFYRELYDMLLQLPFHLIVSLSPDQYLDKLMSSYQIPHHFGYFDPRGASQVEKPTPEIPLVYNLLGKADDFETLVLTYDDLYKYLVAILNPNSLPENIKLALDYGNFDHALFLGFPLDKWWVQLLLRLFGLNPRIDTFAPFENYDDSFEIFCKDNFNITLIRDKEEVFTKKLLQKAQKPEYQISLRALNAPKTVHTGQEIFISYAWGCSREDIVDKLYEKLSSKGYNVIRDKVHLGYRGKIRDFMQRMGTGKATILVLSEEYLKSKYCMQEALEIEKNKDFQDRIFPIVLDDAKIYEAVTQIDYLSHWESEIAKLREKMMNVDPAYTRSIGEELDLFNDIRRFIAQFMDIISNMNNLTPEMHLENGFQALIDTLDTRLKADLTPANL